MRRANDTTNVQRGVGALPRTAVHSCYSNGRESRAWCSRMPTRSIDWSSNPLHFSLPWVGKCTVNRQPAFQNLSLPDEWSRCSCLSYSVVMSAWSNSVQVGSVWRDSAAGEPQLSLETSIPEWMQGADNFCSISSRHSIRMRHLHSLKICCLDLGSLTTPIKTMCGAVVSHFSSLMNTCACGDVLFPCFLAVIVMVPQESESDCL